MGASCSGCPGRESAAVAPEELLASLATSKLTATQRTCLDSWTEIVTGKTSVARAAPRGMNAGTLFFDAFYAELQRRSPATAAFFDHGGIPRKARALMRMVASLLALGGKTGAARNNEVAELATLAEQHALAHGVGPTHYSPYLASLQYALSYMLGGPSEGWTSDVSTAWAAQSSYALGLMLPSATLAERPLVVIVGGGFAGWSLAKALEKGDKHRILLIERKDFLLFNVGGLRSAVRAPDVVDQVILPTRNSLSRASILPADVLEILPEGVRVHGRDALVRFDVCVVATGSSYAFPGKIASTRREEILKAYARCAKQIAEAKRIVICGGGPVGVELAGEIACWYKGAGMAGSAGPRKEVILVQRSERLIPGSPVGVHEASVSILGKLGVEFRLGEEVLFDTEDAAKLAAQNSLVLTPAENGKDVTLRSGGRLQNVDLMFVCSGTQINSASYERSFAGSLNDYKQLLVNDYLQVRDPAEPEQHLDNIFALGDCSAMEANLAPKAGEQAKWLARYLDWRVAQNQAHAKAQQMKKKGGGGDLPRSPTCASVTLQLPGAGDTKTSVSGLAAQFSSPKSKSVGAAYLVRLPTSSSFTLPASAANAAAASLAPASAPVSDATPSSPPSPTESFPPYEGASSSVQDNPRALPSLALSLGCGAGLFFGPPTPPATEPEVVVWEEGKDPTEAAEIQRQFAAKFKAQTLFAPVWWDLIGHPFSERHAVDWRSLGDLSRAEDAAALAQSMHVSQAQAEQLLMQNTSVMQRGGNVQYT